MSIAKELGAEIRNLLTVRSAQTYRRDFIPDPCHEIGFPKKSFQGVMYTCFWGLRRVWDWKGRERKKALYDVIHGISINWNDVVQSMITSQAIYEASLRRCFQGPLLHYPAVAGQNEIPTIAEWHYVFKAFDKSSGGSLSEKIQKLRDIFVAAGVISNFPENRLEFFDTAEVNYYSVRVKNLLKREFPYAIMHKIADGRAITLAEEEEWLEFTRRLAHICKRENEVKKIGVRDLHRCLKALVFCMPGAPMHEEKMQRLARLEWKLCEDLGGQGCFVFEQKDPIYRSWVREQRGLIKCGSYEVELGEEMRGESDPEENRHIVYQNGREIETLIVFSGYNEAFLLLERIACERFGRDFQIAPVQHIDHRGVAMVKNIVGDAAHTYVWNQDPDRARLRARLQSLNQFVRTLLRLRMTPGQRMEHLLRFDQDNQLTLIRYTPFETFNCTKMCAFIRGVAGDDISLYRLILGETRLSNHPVVQFYDKVLGEIQLRNEVVLAEIPLEDVYIESTRSAAEALVESVEGMADAYASEIARKYVIPSEEVLKGQLKVQIAVILRADRIYAPPFPLN